MEKSTRERLLDAGVQILYSRGARAGSARAVEVLAEVPHGTLRHHFGGQDDYLADLAQFVARQVAEAASARRSGVCGDRALGISWVELSLIARRLDSVHRAMEAGHSVLVADLRRVRSLSSREATEVVAQWEGRLLAEARRGR